jgi:hypothetical protein
MELTPHVPLMDSELRQLYVDAYIHSKVATLELVKILNRADAQSEFREPIPPRRKLEADAVQKFQFRHRWTSEQDLLPTSTVPPVGVMTAAKLVGSWRLHNMASPAIAERWRYDVRQLVANWGEAENEELIGILTNEHELRRLQQHHRGQLRGLVFLVAFWIERHGDLPIYPGERQWVLGELLVRAMAYVRVPAKSRQQALAWLLDRRSAGLGHEAIEKFDWALAMNVSPRELDIIKALHSHWCIGWRRASPILFAIEDLELCFIHE